jgi:hypothetical protein
MMGFVKFSLTKPQNIRYQSTTVSCQVISRSPTLYRRNLQRHEH